MVNVNNIYIKHDVAFGARLHVLLFSAHDHRGNRFHELSVADKMEMLDPSTWGISLTDQLIGFRTLPTLTLATTTSHVFAGVPQGGVPCLYAALLFATTGLVATYHDDPEVDDMIVATEYVFEWARGYLREGQELRIGTYDQDYIIITSDEIITMPFPPGEGEFGVTLISSRTLPNLPEAEVRRMLTEQYVSLTED